MLDRRFLDSLSIAAYRCTLGSTVVALNDAARLLLQIHSGDPIELRERFVNAASFDGFLESLQPDGARRFRTQMLRTDGVPIWTEHNAIIRHRPGEEDLIDGIFQDVTTEMQANAQRRLFAEWMRSILDNTPDVAIQIFDRHGVVQLFNDASERIYGYAQHEIAGKRLQEVILRADEEALFDHLLAEIARTGEPAPPLVWHVKSRSAGEKIVWSTLFPLGARSGEPTICCMNVDITEREMSKAQLEIESHLLAQSERLSAVGSWQWHVQSDTVRWSEELCRIFGVAYDSRASQTFAGYLAALHPDDRGLVRTEVERTLETGEGYEMENRAVRPDGSIRTLLCRGDARVENGKVVALFGIAQDITERREREQKERELEQHIRLVTEQLPAAVWSTDADLNLTFARGRALAALTGLDPASLRQQPLRELFGSGPHAGLALEAHTRALAGEARAFEIGVGGKWLEAHVEPLRDPHEGTVIGTTAAALDVTDRKRAEEELAYRAYNDALTALPNRNLLDDRLSLALPQAQRHRKMLAVLYVDIDHFKIINDTLGHATGDKLLTDLAARLKKITRAGDTIARVGGDEFVVLLPEVGSSAEAQRVAEKILETTSKPFELGGKDFYVTASIGIALSPADGETAEELIKNADSAMYRAKETGRAGYQLCTRELTARAFRRLELETSLHRAIEQDELRLHYQPILDIGNGSLLAFEALLRWQREEELLFPDAFLPIAEESHLIVRIGQWVLERACADAARWLGDGGSHVSANVSARHFQQAGFASAVAGALAATGLSPARLELEITESAAMQNLETTTTTLQELRSLGVGIVIDDFGTGHSSLNYLKRFPLTGLKIDRSFVADMMDNRSDEAIVQAIIGTGRALDLCVVAEGVETEAQLERLKRYGCEAAQGFLFSRAVPPEEIAGVTLRLNGRA